MNKINKALTQSMNLKTKRILMTVPYCEPRTVIVVKPCRNRRLSFSQI
jgi:hypothetical protein